MGRTEQLGSRNVTLCAVHVQERVRDEEESLDTTNEPPSAPPNPNTDSRRPAEPCLIGGIYEAQADGPIMSIMVLAHRTTTTISLNLSGLGNVDLGTMTQTSKPPSRPGPGHRPKTWCQNR
ncbi:uncharacterized protein PG986_000721 [Apiospora aurea]|uniref:Uncharacterized protein n=1 Tax=Apiospora aurea TaxID=335848 RepID=A0ABR1QUW2_9PEZI